MPLSNPSEPAPIPCYVYVDSQYVRQQFRAIGLSDEFDPRRTVPFSARVNGREVWPSRVLHYDALDENAPEAERSRQESYLRRIQERDDCHVVTGHVRTSRKKGREQKGVDVQLTVDALEAAKSGVVGVIAIVSGDADFIPLVEAIRRAGPHVFVVAFKSSVSRELRAAADRFIALPEDPAILAKWTLAERAE